MSGTNISADCEFSVNYVSSGFCETVINVAG